MVNPLPVALRAPILRHGLLLWSRWPAPAADFKLRTVKEYLGLEPDLATQAHDGAESRPVDTDAATK